MPPRDGAFPRVARLLTGAQYERVFSRPERSRDKLFTVLGRRNRLGRPRLGLAISRKAIATAVGRNRVKRLVRESFRLRQEWLGPIDVIVMAKSEVLTQDNIQLTRSLDDHWTRITKRCEQFSPP